MTPPAPRRSPPRDPQRTLHRQRERLLQRVEHALDGPMVVLGFVWLALVVVDLVRGLGPLLHLLSNVIWGVFVLNFALEFWLAPSKRAYLRRNWLTALSLLAPALRMLRIVRLARAMRAARVARGMRLLRVVSSTNRGFGAFSRHMSRRGFGYVLGLTMIVLLAGSAGMYAFENGPGGTLHDFGSALWWTAMILTTMGSEVWPHFNAWRHRRPTAARERSDRLAARFAYHLYTAYAQVPDEELDGV